MNWRDISVTLVVLGSIPYSFRQPFIGLLVFSWLAYMRVQDLCWSFARYQRFSYYVALAMFSGFFLFEKKSLFSKDARVGVMLALAGWVTISVFTTNYEVTNRVVYYWLEYLKIISIALITVALIDRPERLKMFVWLVALSLGFFGVKSGLWGILTGGGRQILRGPGGLLEDNNDFSLALTMNLPFLFYLGLSEPDKWIRRGLYGAMFLTCITILLTHSRGGFVAMCATLFIMTWRSRNRVLGIALALVAAIVFLLFAPASVKERLSTLKNVEQDGSAMARLHTWGVALKMVADNPLFGVGFRNFQSAYPDYDPNPLRQKGTNAFFVAHNSYLQLAAESGLPAITMFLVLAAMTFLLLRKVRVMALRRHETNWILNYVRMFEATMVGFYVGATFLNRAHFDFAYHLFAAIVAFGVIAQKEMTSEERYPLRKGTGVARVLANERVFGDKSFGARVHDLGGDDVSLPRFGAVVSPSPRPMETVASKPAFGSFGLPPARGSGIDAERKTPFRNRL